jgi:putative permease
MLEIFNKWYERYLFEEESVLLLVLVTLALVLLATIGDILAPTARSYRAGLPRAGGGEPAVSAGAAAVAGLLRRLYGVHGAVFRMVLLGLLPLVWRQSVGLMTEVPRMVEQGRELLERAARALPGALLADPGRPDSGHLSRARWPTSGRRW